MKRKISRIALIAGLFAVFVVVFASTGASTTIYKQIKLMNKVLTVIYTDYVDPIDYRKLIKGAIDGMTSTLDPHTVFYTPKQYKELQVDTRGKFGGLGIQIGIRDGWLTVIAPIEGTPAYRAGIRAGDRIIKIEGKSTRGITVEEAVTKLRGEPGTPVTITIQREGEPEPFDVTIVRDIIEIKPVPYYGMTSKGVGYIRLTQFSELAADEVGKALRDLKKQGARGIILDLRSNPGGLLSQAVSVAGHFLHKNSLVVFTKGRNMFQSREYYTDFEGEYSEGPLVVLVDGGSASASEIVSGAIQDHDRGVILGMPTFGKGLVQSIRPLDDGTALKITTAKYYIPSGRCIQKEDYLHKPNCAIITDTLHWNPDTLDPWDFSTTPADTDTTEKEKPVYYTENGRKVYGGGGITPDVKYEPPMLNKLEVDLLRKGLFFEFAVHYLADHRDEFKSPDFEVSDQLVEEFKKFLKEKDFEYKSRIDILLEQIDSVAQEDTISEQTRRILDELKQQMKKEDEHDFEESKDFIKRQIKREIVQAIWGEKERYRVVDVPNDPTIQKAVELILNPEEYNKYLQPNNDNK